MFLVLGTIRRPVVGSWWFRAAALFSFGATVELLQELGHPVLGRTADVLDLVAYAWAGLGASFGPVILASLYWRGMRRAGAIAGVLAGGVTVIVWKRLEGGLFDLYEIVPGVVAAGLAILIGSLVSGGGDRDHPAEGEQAQREGPGR